MSLVSYQDVIQQGGFINYDDDSLPVFVGSRLQRGSGGISGVLRGFLKTIAPMAKKAAVSLGKNALDAGVGIAKDALQNKDLKQSLKHNLVNAGLNVTKELSPTTPYSENDDDDDDEEAWSGKKNSPTRPNKRKRTSVIHHRHKQHSTAKTSKAKRARVINSDIFG